MRRVAVRRIYPASAMRLQCRPVNRGLPDLRERRGRLGDRFGRLNTQGNRIPDEIPDQIIECGLVVPGMLFGVKGGQLRCPGGRIGAERLLCRHPDLVGDLTGCGGGRGVFGVGVLIVFGLEYPGGCAFLLAGGGTRVAVGDNGERPVCRLVGIEEGVHQRLAFVVQVEADGDWLIRHERSMGVWSGPSYETLTAWGSCPARVRVASNGCMKVTSGKRIGHQSWGGRMHETRCCERLNV